MNLPLDIQGEAAVAGREPFGMKQWQKKPRFVCDDVWTFNSQGSTQCMS
jgi:hypothetical protein